jgi:hypothetical protein
MGASEKTAEDALGLSLLLPHNRRRAPRGVTGGIKRPEDNRIRAEAEWDAVGDPGKGSSG